MVDAIDTLGRLDLSSRDLKESEFKRISAFVYEHCRINLHDGKRELVRARLGKRLRELKFQTYQEYFDYVMADASGAELNRMIDAITTNLTSFFRENQHFEFLRKEGLPALLEAKRKSGARRLRGWSAGCSSGEEPYTMALVLLDSIPDIKQWDVQLLASDLSYQMLAQGRQGVYDEERVKPVSQALRTRCFERGSGASKGQYRVKDWVKELISFRHLNLFDPWPFKGKFDFIFCRNVMIYFDKPTQARLIARFASALEPGGYYFIGHAESLAGLEHDFAYMQPTIYRKK